MRVVEATGWTWDYVRTLPLRRFWAVLKHYAERPALVDLARAWVGWKPPREEKRKPPPASREEAEAEARALCALMNGGGRG